MTMLREQLQPNTPEAEDALQVEAVIAEARRRGRRRRRRSLIALGTVVVVLVGGLLVLHPWQARGARGQTHNQAASANLLPGFPASFVAYDGSDPTTAGIDVISSATGRTLRTLVPSTSDDSQFEALSAGFQVTRDGQTVYFVRENPARSALTIASVSTSGGPVRDVAVGTHPVISPDGNLLAYRPDGDSYLGDKFKSKPEFVVLDTRTGKSSTVLLPGAVTGQDITAAWLPDSKTLVVHTSDLQPSPAQSALGGNVRRDPQLTARSYSINAMTMVVSLLPQATTKALEPTATYTPTILGSGANGAGIQISGRVASASGPSVVKVGELNVHTGATTWQAVVPGGSMLGAVIASAPNGTDVGNFLLVDQHDGTAQEWSTREPDSTRTVGNPGRVLSLSGVASTS